MSYKENNSLNKNNSEISSPGKSWILVQWIGSCPSAYDIINIADVVLDNFYGEDCLKIGNTIMVQCGRIKSAAEVKQISDNTNMLFKVLRKLQKENLNEKQNTPQAKKRRLEKKVPDTNIENKTTQTTIAFDETFVTKLLLENQKLKDELSESKQIINTICQDLNSVVYTAQKKNHKYNSDDSEISGSPTTTKINRKHENIGSTCTIVEKNDVVVIGHGKTVISRHCYNRLNWHSFSSTTRKLLMDIFSRDILATHTLTGKPSPAFMSCEMPLKMKLDTVKVADIIELVSDKCGVAESMVRSIITTKCADENKMWKKRLEKNKNKSGDE